MDYEVLVDDQVEDGKTLVKELTQSGFDVAVALWARTSEEGLWYLYIGSTSLRTMSLADAYRAIYEVLRHIPSTMISISFVKIIDAENPISKDAIKARDRSSHRQVTHYLGKRLGNLAIEEAFIYPRTGLMSRTEVLQTVTTLVSSSTGVPAPSLVTLSLRDGTSIQAVPVGFVSRGPEGLVQIILHDPSTSTNRSIPVDDVVGIM